MLCGNPDCKEEVDGTFYCSDCDDHECPVCKELTLEHGEEAECSNGCEIPFTPWGTIDLGS
jgi:hypothetical protein